MMMMFSLTTLQLFLLCVLCLALTKAQHPSADLSETIKTREKRQSSLVAFNGQLYLLYNGLDSLIGSSFSSFNDLTTLSLLSQLSSLTSTIQSTPAVVQAGQIQPIGSACLDDTNCQNNGGTCQNNTITYEVKLSSGPPCPIPVTGTIQSTTSSRVCRCTSDRQFACSDTLGFVCIPPGTATIRPGG